MEKFYYLYNSSILITTVSSVQLIACYVVKPKWVFAGPIEEFDFEQ
jgi:hypothetical protein